MTLETTRPLESKAHTNGSEAADRDFNPDIAPLTEQERCCAQDLLAIVTQMKWVIAHDRDGTGLPITAQQYQVLKLLKEQERLISELADLFKVSRPTMTRIIDGLEGRRRHNGTDEGSHSLAGRERRAKLVERVDSLDDRRLVYARITQEGLDMLNYYHEKAEESVTAVLRRIPPEEMFHLERSLQVLRSALQENS